MKKTQAFTLIELLVVISIIAILAGFAMPVLSRAIERGRATECKNNLQNIGKGILTYLTDNDDTMFAADKEPWPTLLHGKYVKDWKAFRSPFDKITKDRPKGDNAPVPVSYGINKNVLEPKDAKASFIGRWVNSGSAVILAAPAVDTSSTGKNVTFAGSAFSDQQVKVTTPTGEHLGTHGARESVNVLFADGHVTEMDWSKYIKNSKDEEKQRWDPMYVAADK